MAQVPKKPPAQLSEMTVLEKGSEVARPSSMGSTRQNIKKMPSEGLTVLPSEPGLVKFERVASPPCAESLCSSRVGSAGRVEKSLQMARKKEASDDRPTRNSKDSVIAQGVVGLQVKHQGTTEDRLLAENQTIQPNTTAPVTTKGDSDSSNADSSDSDDDDDDDEVQVPSTNGAAVQVDKLEAPVELKGEFLSAVMDEDYEKAKDLCQKILLLEPDNKVCSEFHAVIVEKIKQEEEDENDGDDDDSEESSDDEDEETDEETDDDSLEDDNDDDDESDSDDDFAMPSGPINLIMGGLPIKLQNR